MRRQTKMLLAIGATAAVASGVWAGVGIADSPGGNDKNEAPIAGDALAKANAAALAHTGGGRVTDTEVGDEESLYEVEVTFADGRQVDVQLDDRFQVVTTVADEETPTDDH